MKHGYWLTGLVGVALMIAPFVLGFAGDPAALWSSVLLGAAVLILSILKGLLRDRVPWEYWIIGLLSLLIAGSPYFLGFNTVQQTFLVTTVLGIAAFALCVYQIFVADVRNQ